MIFLFRKFRNVLIHCRFRISRDEQLFEKKKKNQYFFQEIQFSFGLFKRFNHFKLVNKSVCQTIKEVSEKDIFWAFNIMFKGLAKDELVRKKKEKPSNPFQKPSSFICFPNLLLTNRI